MSDTETSARRRGRPPAFDRDRAVEAAMRLFWRDGYEATGVAALAAAMGLSPPSLYAAFGSKRGLFLAAAAAYADGPGDPLRDAPTAREAARAVLEAAAARFAGEGTPAGCLLARSAGAREVGDEVARRRAALRDGLRARIEADAARGLLPPGTDAGALAGHAVAVVQGLAALARDGAERADLLAIAAAAMEAWPPGAAPQR